MYTSLSSTALNKLGVPSRWSSGLSFSRSFSFIRASPSHAMPNVFSRAPSIKGIFMQRAKVIRSLGMHIARSSHGTSLSLYPSFSLATRLTVSNESQRVLHESLLSFSPLLSLPLSLFLFIVIVIVIIIVLVAVLRKAIVQDWRKPIAANPADRPALLYATIESSILRTVLRPNSCRICNGRLVTGARFLPLRNSTL